MSATATVVVDLGFGDAGKGSIVDAVVRRRGADGVVRFNGGCQAGHAVIDDERTSADGSAVGHIFAQFGAGTLAGARTHLSRHMLVEPISLFNEAEHLVEQCGIKNPVDLLTVDPRALVTTPWHRFANQEKERRRGDGNHGSCGRGIGETVEFMLNRPLDAIRVGDLWRPTLVAEKMSVLADYYQGFDLPAEWIIMWSEAITRFADLVELVHDRDLLMSWRAGMDHVVFEGAQGVLIDERYGFAPYHTWSNCTFGNALELLQEAAFPRADISKCGVTRAYQVRHGPGPMPTENADMTRMLPDQWNTHNDWQGDFRVGNLDMVLLRYAIEACGGIDELAVTCLDRVLDRNIVWMTAHTEARMYPGRPFAWEMDKIEVDRSDGPAICVAYRHPRWGLFEQPIRNWQLPMRPREQNGSAQVLAEMQPILEPWPDNFPYWISQQVAAPATILSYGPTAKDKRWLTHDGVTDAGVLSGRA